MLRETSSILRLIIWGAYTLAGLIVIAGIVLVCLGSGGNTEFTFFGQTFRSTSVAIAGIFLGASILVLLVRRSLSSLDKTIQSGTPQKVNAWGVSRQEHINEEGIRKMIRGLSENQLAVIEVVEQAEGINIVELAKRLAQAPSIVLFRCVSLQDLNLLAINDGANLFLSDEVKSFLKENSYENIQSCLPKQAEGLIDLQS
jgi:hypothetical protein